MFKNWSPCEVVASVSAVAVAFAKDRSTDEIAFWGTYLSALGDTLATYAVVQEACEGNSVNIQEE